VVEDGGGKESLGEFQELFAELIEDLQPQGRVELSLVETVAICDWRYRRTLRAEAAEIVDRVLPPVYTTDMILRYQSAVYRQKMQSLLLLEKLQRRRGSLPDPTERDAAEK
jgi:hypothetical protein